MTADQLITQLATSLMCTQHVGGRVPTKVILNHEAEQLLLGSPDWSPLPSDWAVLTTVFGIPAEVSLDEDAPMFEICEGEAWTPPGVQP